MADCQNCIQLKSIEDRLGKVERTVDDKGDMFEVRITKLERRGDVTDQKFIQVFEKLDEIIAILRERESRLPNLLWQVASIVMASLISGIGVFLWRR